MSISTTRSRSPTGPAVAIGTPCLWRRTMRLAGVNFKLD
jgi:hypothetical protein